LLVDDILYVNSGSNIHALDKTNGNEIWEAHVNTISLGPKFTYYDGYIYYVGASELNIINAETGEIEHQMYAKDSTAFWYVTAGAGKVFLQSAEHIYCYEPWKKDD
jgi:outer membrane protein assembly factor BamB